MKTISVSFNQMNGPAVSPKNYTYHCADENVKVGDTCVVDVKGRGYQCVTVLDITDGYSDMDDIKLVVCIVDDSGYKQRVVNEAKRRSILKQLEVMDRKRAAEARYAYLAQGSEEAAKLLKDLATLG